MNVSLEYERWIQNPNLPKNLRDELESIRTDERAIYDRFYQDLEFGTGGLRGVLGAGLNRMNIFTVRRASLGLAKWVARSEPDAAKRSVVVGYDCRRMSTEFALEVGLVMAEAGIRAHVFTHLCPTPELSFAVRELGASTGVMITASHNPPEYNGYKVYGSDGCQVLPDAASDITSLIESISDIFAVPVMGKDEAEAKGLLAWVSSEIDHRYCDRVMREIRIHGVTDEQRADVRVVYTPLHGTGYIPVKTVLGEMGYKQAYIVPEQAEPDGEFRTVKSPNPEEHDALKLAIEAARRQNADVVMGTDPDADRVGVAVRTATGEYRLLSGNQTGGLLLDFLLKQRKAEGKMPTNPIVFKTIVTSELGAAIARRHSVAVEDTLTGFKYIGERIGHYERTGEKTFLFGYEESYGYLISPFVRDKDAVQSCLLIAEMAAWYKSRGLTLADGLEQLFSEVGWYAEQLISVTMPGADGVAKIQAAINGLREQPIEVDGLVLTAVEDYETRMRKARSNSNSDWSSEPLHLPQSDVIRYLFEGGSWLAVRPSGTEPKMKIYLGAKAATKDGCEEILQSLNHAVQRLKA